jgi:hypothetical protein
MGELGGLLSLDEESRKVLPEKGKILIGIVVGSKASVQDQPFEITSA